ncbi:MAG: leucine-rich repeat protein, partial [Clostridia bacterium]|nr:leucine-rich repeat protein [Clostridia bacterium]
AVSVGASASAAGAAAAVGGAAVGIGARLAAIPIGLKIVAGLTAASLVLGGIPAAILLSRPEERAETKERATEAVAVLPLTEKTDTEKTDTEEAEWALEGVIPEGGSYLCADGRRLGAGEPFPASPEAGDRLYLADYVYTYEGVSKIRMEGKDEVHLWRDGFDDGDSGMNDSDAFGTWFPIALENKESYSPIASSIIGKPIRALNGTFANCTRLTLAPSIPSTVTTVAGAFFGCTALRSAPVLPEGVERYTGAFYGCTALEGDVVFLGGLDRTSEYYGDSVFRDTVNAINLVGTCPEEDLITIALLSDNTRITVHGKAVFASGGPNEIPSEPEGTIEKEEAAASFVVPSGCRYVSVDGTVASEGERVNLVKGDRLEDATYAYFYQEAYRYEEKEAAWVKTGRDGAGFLPVVLDRTAASYGEFHPSLSPQITQLYETFADCTNMTVSPEIPEGVTAMIETFRNCRRLRVTPQLPDGVTSLFDAFYGCTNLKTVKNFPKEALEMLQCFYGCTFLTEVPSEFPDKVQDLTNVFCGCTSLVTVPSEIPASVQNITGAFSGCKSLLKAPLFAGFVENMDVMYFGCESLAETPQFPVGIRSMQGSFSGCTSLVTVHALPSTLEDMNSAFSGCVLLATMSPIPGSVRSMVGAFTDCTSLVQTPVLPEGVEDLSRTFMGCTALVSSADIPSTVKRMEHTFSECTALVSAPLLPEGVENISGVFYGCKLIESVEYIPSTVTDMSRAFAYCSALSGTIRVEALSLTAETVSGAFVRVQKEILLVGGSPHLSLIREHGGSGFVEIG